MSDVDEMVRRGLAEAASELEPLDSASLAVALAAARSRRSRRRRRRTAAALVAAAAVAAVAVGLVATTADDVEVVADDPQVQPAAGPLDRFGPGWHTIDPGPVPAMAGSSMAWFDDHLVVAGVVPVRGEDPDRAEAWMWDPTDGSWSQLPDLAGMGSVVVVDAGERLVAIGSRRTDSIPWATWQPGDAEWARHRADLAPGLAALGAQGPTDLSGWTAAVWTGERVVDVTHGAVLDPHTGSAEPLPLPDDLVAFTALVYTTPVWTGDEVVLSSWTDRPGLAWDRFGRSFRQVPGVPRALLRDPSVVEQALAVADGDDVVVLSTFTSAPGAGARLDPDTGKWFALPDRVAGEPYCPYLAATVGGRPVVQGCPIAPDAEPLRLEGGTWTTIPAAPHAEPCCLGTWLGTDQALFTWSTDIDELNNPRAPYAEGALWMPG